jgi:hypothetical protein
MGYSKLEFQNTKYEFKTHYGDRTNCLHIYVNDELQKVREQTTLTPQTIEECLELIKYYEL